MKTQTLGTLSRTHRPSGLSTVFAEMLKGTAVGVMRTLMLSMHPSLNGLAGRFSYVVYMYMYVYTSLGYYHTSRSQKHVL